MNWEDDGISGESYGIPAVSTVYTVIRPRMMTPKLPNAIKSRGFIDLPRELNELEEKSPQFNKIMNTK